MILTTKYYLIGDLVADFFCGSGTTALVAARLGRRFIASDVTWRAVHTTRARLVGELKEPFRLLKVASWKVDHSDLQLSTFNLRLVGRNIFIKIATPADLDYWEVDPAWDGEVFRSAAQAVRPRRKGTIPLSLELAAYSGGKALCARLVDAVGEQFQITL